MEYLYIRCMMKYHTSRPYKIISPTLRYAAGGSMLLSTSSRPPTNMGACHAEALMPCASSVSTRVCCRSSMTQRSVTKTMRRSPWEAEGKVISSILGHDTSHFGWIPTVFTAFSTVLHHFSRGFPEFSSILHFISSQNRALLLELLYRAFLYDHQPPILHLGH